MKSAWEYRKRQAVTILFPSWAADEPLWHDHNRNALRSRSLEWLEAKRKEGVIKWFSVECHRRQWVAWVDLSYPARLTGRTLDHALVQIVLAVAKLERKAKRA